MFYRRYGAGVGVSDGVLYAIGDSNGSVVLISAEMYRLSDEEWSSIYDMNLSRYRPVVIALDGLMYVKSGVKSAASANIEIYNPKIDTWEVMEFDESDVFPGYKIYAGMVINGPSHFKTN
ncbi:kelch-like protein 2 [Myzus persicae]|uniref:kelch-like protein 2 n=1 Tax=Myzus persicae TaxID=13164 RepID=UPI000B9343E5|nr:kelch-like protein 2 [Myzus persicae]